MLAQEFGGAWQDGEVAEHFLMIGTSDMERSVLGLLGRARLVDFSKVRAAAATVAACGCMRLVGRRERGCD